MWIESLQIDGFGKLERLTLELGRGICLIHGPNETGKSTLQDFLWAMLYGPEGAGGEVLGRYAPWGRAGFGGEIAYHLEKEPGKGKVILRRDFQEGRLDVEGEGIAARGKIRGKEEGYPGRVHLGMDLGVFLSTCLIRQGEVGALRGKADISARLMNLAEMGDEEGGVDEAIRKVRSLADVEIGSDGKGPLGASMKKLEALIRERQEALFRRDECRHDVLARQKEQIRGERAQKRLDRIVAGELKVRANALGKRVIRIQHLQESLEEIERALEAGRNLPVLDRRGLENIEAERYRLRETLTRVDREIRELEDKVKEMVTRTAGLEVYLEMPAGARENLAGMRARVVTGRARLDEEEHEMLERRRELQLAQEEYDALKEKYAAFDPNFEQVMRDLRESEMMEGELEKRRKQLEDTEQKERELKRRLEQVGRQARIGRIVAGTAVLGLVVAAMLVSRAFLGNLWIGATGGAVIVAIASVVWSSFHRKEEAARAEVRLTSSRIPRIREEIKEGETVIRLKKDAYLRAGVTSLEEFRTGFERYRSIDNKLGGVRDALRRESARYRKSKVELLDHENRARELLLQAGLLDGGEPLTEEAIDAFGEKLDEVSGIRHEKEVLEGLLGLKVTEQQSLRDQIGKMEDEARTILEDAGVDSVDAFEDLCEQEDNIRKLLDQQREEKAQLAGLLSGGALADLEAELEELRDKIPAGLEGMGDADAETDEETRRESADETAQDSGLGASEIVDRKERIEHLEGLVEEANRKVAILDDRIREHTRSVRHLADIEADIEDVGRRIVFLKGERAVLAEVVRSLQTLKEEYLMRRFAPRLETIASPLLRSVTGGRYRDIHLDEDLNLRVSVEGESDPRDIAGLSLGTRDQIFFILRHAIGCILGETGEPLPLILDDTLVSFDAERRMSALRFLVEFSRNGQAILLTSHRHQARDLEEACREAGMHVEKRETGPFWTASFTWATEPVSGKASPKLAEATPRRDAP